MRDFRRLSIPRKAHPVVQKLWEAMNHHRICVEDVAERSGVAAKTIIAWRTQRNPNVTNIEACLNVVGLELTAKIRGGE